MAQKEIEATVSAEFVLRYDPDSAEFKRAIKSHHECVTKGADIEEVLKHIAYSIARFSGVKDLIEGVGYVSISGSKEHIPEGEDWCGVDVDEFAFEIDDRASVEVALEDLTDPFPNKY
jgi:hypothetical protein